MKNNSKNQLIKSKEAMEIEKLEERFFNGEFLGTRKEARLYIVALWNFKVLKGIRTKYSIIKIKNGKVIFPYE